MDQPDQGDYKTEVIRCGSGASINPWNLDVKFCVYVCLYYCGRDPQVSLDSQIGLYTEKD